MITILPYQARWPIEARAIGDDLRTVLENLAVRIDHIGSTAVPGLAAKDIVDIQVTVAELEARVELALVGAGYRRIEKIVRDHAPPGSLESDEQWEKWFFKGPAGKRAVNLHVRVAGRANQRYPLLFRDYLRAHESAALAYAQVKMAIARYHADSIDAYCDIKDPVCDIIMGSAEGWARGSGWEVGPSDF